MSHKLLILGSLDEFVALVASARARGYETIVCDGYLNGPAKKVADKAYNIDVHNLDAIANLCKEENIDGIIGSYSDFLFEQITKIAGRTGLKWYVMPDMLKYYREKDVAKQVLRELKIAVPQSVCISKHFRDCELKDIKFPVVIKPINGYGSKGIHVAHSISEIRDQYDDVIEYSAGSIKDRIMVEEYSHGYEYNMMSWLIDGTVYVISIADREKNPQIGNDIPLLNRIVYPAKNIEIIVDEAKNVLQKFADYTGQKSGPLSMQFFYNDYGVVVGEIAGRFFGYEHELVTLCSGLSIEDILLNYVYNEDENKRLFADYSPFYHKYCEGLYFVGIQDKVIKDQTKIYALSKDHHVVEYKAFYKNGEKVDNYGPHPYLARYYIRADSREELNQVTQQFFDEMYVVADDGSQVDRKLILENR